MIGFQGKNVTPRGTFRFLTKTEEIRNGDLVRFTERVGWSDYHNGDDVKRMNWHPVENGIPGWIGKTIQAYEEFPAHYGTLPLEIIRKEDP